jgi:hypothetical protein
MSIRTSIYDFFAYVIPGALCLITIVFGLEVFGLFQLWNTIKKGDLIVLALLILLSYVAGYIIWYINSKLIRIFETRPISKLAFDEFKILHPNVHIDIDPNDWQIWFASIRRESIELAMEIEKQKATSYLLRGISFSFALLCLITIAGVVASKLVWWCSFGSMGMAGLVYISIKESIKFNKWFFFLIFEIIISRKEPYHFIKDKQA